MTSRWNWFSDCAATSVIDSFFVVAVVVVCLIYSRGNDLKFVVAEKLWNWRIGAFNENEIQRQQASE